MNIEELYELVHTRLSDVMEHFDSVQFLGSYVNDDGDTEQIKVGRGNWYARIGMAREFLDSDQGRTQGREIAEAIEDKEL